MWRTQFYISLWFFFQKMLNWVSDLIVITMFTSTSWLKQQMYLKFNKKGTIQSKVILEIMSQQHYIVYISTSTCFSLVHKCFLCSTHVFMCINQHNHFSIFYLLSSTFYRCRIRRRKIKWLLGDSVSTSEALTYTLCSLILRIQNMAALNELPSLFHLFCTLGRGWWTAGLLCTEWRLTEEVERKTLITMSSQAGFLRGCIWKQEIQKLNSHSHMSTEKTVWTPREHPILNANGLLNL